MRKLNMNFVVGKKQIVLAALVMCLSLAVYINWVYSQEIPEFTPTDGEGITDMSEGGKNYGDSQYVDGISNGDAYFAEAKLNRQKTRDEVSQTLKSLLDSEQISDSQKSELAMKVSDIADTIESEGKIEHLIKAKVFNQCMVYYDAQKVDVIVQTNGLEAAEVAQMKDIIMKEVSVPVENIAIIEVN